MSDKTPEDEFEQWLKKTYPIKYSVNRETVRGYDFFNMRTAFYDGQFLERAKRQAVVKWPSEDEVEKEYNSLPQTQGAHFGWVECYSWLKSQVKPVELPTFTDEEITKIAEECFLGEDEQMACFTGFRKAIELIKSRIENKLKEQK